jgi:hypothetical protein
VAGCVATEKEEGEEEEVRPGLAWAAFDENEA